MRIKFFVLTILFLFFAIKPVFALVTINEIMYDLTGNDTDREWVELHNSSTDPITIIGGSANEAWRIYDGTNHLLGTTPVQGNMTIPSGGFAIIAKNASGFLSDYPNFTGTIIQSSISLNNTEDTIGLRIGTNGSFFDEFSYQNTLGATGDGNSLQRKPNGEWIAGIPTPGSQNTSNTPASTPTPTPTPTSTPAPTKTPSPAPTPKKTASPASTPTPSRTPSNSPTSFNSTTPPNFSKTSNRPIYKIASVAGITTSATPSSTPTTQVSVKNQIQINPIVWVGLIFVFAGAGSIGYIYLKSNGRIPFKF